MHQEHNVPWNALSSNLEFIRNNCRHSNPPRTDLFSRSPFQSKQLNFFIQSLVNGICTFSSTERAKYPTQLRVPASGTLFPDDLLDRYPEILTKKNQLVETWISAAEIRSSYSTSNASLADVVKVLLDEENDLSTLLAMAQHTRIPLKTLNNLSWGHHFGLSRVAEHALLAYIYLNVLGAMDLLRDNRYKELSSFQQVVHRLTVSMDYDMQQVPHRLFFWSTVDKNAVNTSVDERFEKVPFWKVEIDLLKDLGRLEGYLKKLFQLLYRYDVVIRESGGDPEWEKLIVYTLVELFRFKMKDLFDESFDESENRWTARLVGNQ